MLYLLQIGIQQFILESDAGVSTIMKTLSKATLVDRDKRYSGGEIELDHKPIQLNLEALPNLKFVKRSRGSTGRPIFVTPELLPPHQPTALPGVRKLLSREQLFLGGGPD